MPAAVKRSDQAKIRQAKQVTTKAINQARRIHDDVARDRSTRTRAAYKVKAEALDKVAEVLGS